MSFTPLPSTAELAHRLGASAHSCAIISSEQIAPSVREVVLGGGALELTGFPGQDVMVRVEAADERFVRRRYSVRHVDGAADRFTLWVTTEHDGPGSNWARAIIPGDHVDVIGPRGKIGLAPDVDWHLIVGDASALASAYRLAESVRPPGRVTVVIQVDDAADMLTTTPAEGVEMDGVFVERRGRDLHDAGGLIDALAAVHLPPGAGHAYLFGEFAVVKTLRAVLSDRGLSEDEVSHKSYWRAGRDNADHGEPVKDED